MASILDRRLILVTGKGGVGRSTVAAAIASATARRGRRTLLYEASANDRFGSFFGTAPVGTAIARLADNLYAVNTNPGSALEEYGMMVLRFKRVYKMVFENRLTRYFLRAIPGLDDYSVLGKAWYHTTETSGGKPAWDTLVFDMPASGHTLSMLGIPKVILETVPEGPLTRDAAEVRDLLRDARRTAVVVVTLAEEMPANEARELSQALDQRLGLRVSHVLVNQVYPDRFPAESAQESVLDALLRGPRAAELDALAAHAELERSRRRLNEEYIRELRTSIPAPQSELPFLFVPHIGQREIQELSRLLERNLGAP